MRHLEQTQIRSIRVINLKPRGLNLRAQLRLENERIRISVSQHRAIDST